MYAYRTLYDILYRPDYVYMQTSVEHIYNNAKIYKKKMFQIIQIVLYKSTEHSIYTHTQSRTHINVNIFKIV